MSKSKKFLPYIIGLILLIILLIILATASIWLYLILGKNNNSSEVIEEPVSSTEPDVPGSSAPYNFDYSWAKDNFYIAHAMGGINGDNYTNSLEAFLENYQFGHRLFEVDLSITENGDVVLTHDPESWRAKTTVKSDSDLQPLDSEYDPTLFTTNNFISSLYNDKYHTLTLDDLLQLIQRYPDIYIITDTKYVDETNIKHLFSQIVNSTQAIDESLLDRFIIQIGTPDIFSWVMSIHPWRSVIYTLYPNYANWTPENVLNFCETSGIRFVTMWSSWLTADIGKLWHAAGIDIATHTVNNLNVAQKLHSLGAYHIYTDFLLPQTAPTKR